MRRTGGDWDHVRHRIDAARSSVMLLAAAATCMLGHAFPVPARDVGYRPARATSRTGTFGAGGPGA